MSSGELIAFPALGVVAAGLTIHALNRRLPPSAKGSEPEVAALPQQGHRQAGSPDGGDAARVGDAGHEMASNLTWVTNLPPETPRLAPIRHSTTIAKP